MYFSVESIDYYAKKIFFLQIRMVKETLGINTITMSKTSVFTTARKVCQWSDFIIFSATVLKMVMEKIVC